MTNSRNIPIHTILAGILALTCCLPLQAKPDTDSPNSRYISREFIERYGYEYDPYGLASLLATQPGVALQSSGDPGGEDWLTFRGNPRDSSRMTLVLLDGVPHNGASNATLEFNTIPLSLIEDITIYYGPLPARFGGFTSVVDIKTRSASNRVEGVVYGGSLDTFGAGITASRAGEDWGVTFDLQGQQTEGLEGEKFIRRTVDNSNPFAPEIITEYPQYENREYKQLVPMVTGHLDVAQSLRLGMLFQGIFTDKNYADGFSHDEPDRPAKRERDYYKLGLSLTPQNSEDDYALNLYYTDEDKETLALDDEFVNYGTQRKKQLGLRGHYGFSLTENLQLRVGGEYIKSEGEVTEDTAWDPVNEEIIHFDSSADFDSVYFTEQDELEAQALFTEAFWAPADFVDLTLGLRYDDLENTDSDTSYQLAATFKLTDNLSLHVSGGETSRYPSLNEYNNSRREPTILGPPFPGLVDPEDVANQNAALEMERSSGGEIGLTLESMGGQLRSELVVFDYEHEGEIFIDVRTVPTNPDSPFFDILGPEINVLLRNNRPTKDQSSGVELALNFDTEGRGLYLNGTYNELERDFTDGRDSQNQAFMPPKFYASAGGYFELFSNGKLDLQMVYRGDTSASLQERGALPDTELDSSFLMHVGYQHTVFKHTDVFFRVYNLFDEGYETFYGLPMVERHVTAGVRVRF